MYRIAVFSILPVVFLLKKRSDYERKQLKTEYYCFFSEKLRTPRRLIFLSDLHEAAFGEGNRQLLERLRELRPELILIGGDFIISRKYRGERRDCTDQVERTAALLRELRQEFPVIYALGNHESRMLGKAGYRERELFSGMPQRARERAKGAAACWRQALSGIELLDRKSICPAGMPELQVSGLTLPLSYYGKLFFRKKKPLSDAAYAEYSGRTAEKTAEKERFQIVLLHSPLYHKEAIRNGADLVLSGHFHGGTVRLPYLGGLMSPQLQFFRKECAGVFPYRSGRMLVNRGLGTHSVNVRLNDLPEISVIDLLPPEGKA